MTRVEWRERERAWKDFSLAYKRGTTRKIREKEAIGLVLTMMERVESNDHPLAASNVPSAYPLRSNAVSSGSPGRPTNCSESMQQTQQQELPYISSGYKYPNQESQRVQGIARSPAASLIQSAARSVLDDATPNSTVISEDASEISTFYDANLGGSSSKTWSQQQQRHIHNSYRHPVADLRSLETKTLPAIPDEQDRRRFIGCLAAVLASSYGYDEAVGESDDEASSSTAWAADYTESLYNDYDDDDEDDDIIMNDDGDAFAEERKDIRTQQHGGGSQQETSKSSSMTSSNDVFYSNRCASFESLGATEVSATSTLYDERKQTRQAQEQQNRIIRKDRRRSRQRDSTTSSSRQPAGTAGLFGTNNKEKAKLALQRHRSRRYEVLSKLLISSSELLLLDKSVARAFLPMLSRVLVPQCPARDIAKATMASTTASAVYTSASSNRSRPPLSSRRGSGSKTRSRSVPSSPTHVRYQQHQFCSPATTSALHSSFDAEMPENIPFSDYNTRDTTTRETESVPLLGGRHSTTTTTTNIDEFRPPIETLDNEDELYPFLESLTPGAGFRCISIFLLKHLLTSEVGYDARIRHVLKKLSVLVLVHDMEGDPVERNYSLVDNDNSEATYSNSRGNGRNRLRQRQERILRATRKFEALEQSIALRLIRFSMPAIERMEGKNKNSNNKTRNSRRQGGGGGGITKEQIVRGVKIGGAGIVAGTLFALTGGLAAPGIAMGVAAVAGAAAGTAAVATLTSAVVVTTIFGVGGGGLAAYKMHRRTQGLTEFEFRKETDPIPNSRQSHKDGSESKVTRIEPELFSVLCFSGWLRDSCDYQRPWGIQPTSPKIRDRQEMLERFYSIYSPDHVPKSGKILSRWKGEEDKLWQILRDKYGRDPDSLFPLADGLREHGGLTLEQEEVLDKLFVELGYSSIASNNDNSCKHTETQMSPFERMKNSWRNRHSGHHEVSNIVNVSSQSQMYDSLHGPSAGLPKQESFLNATSYSYDTGGASSQVTTKTTDTADTDSQQQEEKMYKLPKHLSTVWDYKMTYGGEMYTVRWESELLKRICDCVMDLAMDVVSGATKQILKQTVLSTLLASFMWPSYLLNVANMIDGDWTLAVERADEAGKVLAKTLLFSRAGRRPVTLVGYSFGGRIIYSCLKELSRYQEEWEWYQELLEESEIGRCSDHARLAKYQEKMKGMREPASIIEDVVLMGLPNHLSLSSWRACRQVVSGRLVNCYSTKDLILSLMFQAKRFSGGSLNNGMGSFLKPVCGTTPVNEPGVENVDCSDLILGHQDYCFVAGKILERIRFGEPLRCRSHTLLALASDGCSDSADVTAKKLTYRS